MNKNVFKGIWLITKCFPLKKIIFILQFYYSFLHENKRPCLQHLVMFSHRSCIVRSIHFIIFSSALLKSCGYGGK